MKWIWKHWFKFLWCVIWHGEHDYKRVSPILSHGEALFECKRCGHTHVM